MEANSCQRMCHCGLSLPISLKPVGGIPSHLHGSHIVREKGLLLSEPALKLCITMGLAIVFIDEYNHSKVFKMASNSFEVTNVPF